MPIYTMYAITNFDMTNCCNVVSWTLDYKHVHVFRTHHILPIFVLSQRIFSLFIFSAKYSAIKKLDCFLSQDWEFSSYFVFSITETILKYMKKYDMLHYQGSFIWINKKMLIEFLFKFVLMNVTNQHVLFVTERTN